MDPITPQPQYQAPMDSAVPSQAQPPKHFLNKKFAITFVILILLGVGTYAGIWYWQNQQVAQEVVPTYTPNEPNELKTYINEVYGFSVNYYPEMKVSNYGMGNTIFSVTGEELLGVDVWDFWSLGELSNYMKEMFSSFYGGQESKVINSRSLIFAGHNAVEIIVNLGGQIKKILCVEKENSVYLLEFPDTVELNNIASSFVFTGEEWKNYKLESPLIKLRYPDNYSLSTTTKTNLSPAIESGYATITFSNYAGDEVELILGNRPENLNGLIVHKKTYGGNRDGGIDFSVDISDIYGKAFTILFSTKAKGYENKQLEFDKILETFTRSR